MKVKELIKLLKQMDQEATVRVPSDNFGETGDMADDIEFRTYIDGIVDIHEVW